MLTVTDEVQSALAAGRAVVALESTIICHGFAAPENLEVARKLESAVRGRGAVPATIAVLDGAIRVGLSAAQLEALASLGPGAAKASASDLAAYVGLGSSAATTVSATALIAARAGIRVFATGGIGGVHRGDTGDVSSDLMTLSRVPVAVVSAGPKAILDVARTREMLDTCGVLVVGFKTGVLPAFYSRESSVTLDLRAQTPEAVANILQARFDLLGQGGVLVANPIPVAAEIPRQVIEPAIAEALAEAATEGIVGKALTPFLLTRLAALSKGATVTANRVLAQSNAELAAAIAVALSGV